MTLFRVPFAYDLRKRRLDGLRLTRYSNEGYGNLAGLRRSDTADTSVNICHLVGSLDVWFRLLQRSPQKLILWLNRRRASRTNTEYYFSSSFFVSGKRLTGIDASDGSVCIFATSASSFWIFAFAALRAEEALLSTCGILGTASLASVAARFASDSHRISETGGFSKDVANFLKLSVSSSDSFGQRPLESSSTRARRRPRCFSESCFLSIFGMRSSRCCVALANLKTK